MKRISLLLLMLITGSLTFGQMVEGGVTLYGNEWVVDGQVYYKIKIAKDGIYKVELPALRNAGLSGNVTGADFMLFRNGKEVPIKVSQDGLWGDEDFFTFRGYRNKAELDKYLFPNGLTDNVNPIASLFNDTAAYFLTIQVGVAHLRTQTRVNDLTNVPVAEPYIIALSEAELKDVPHNKVNYSGTHANTTSQFDQGKGMVRSAANPTVPLQCPELIQADFIPTIRYRGITNYGNVSMNLGHDLKININGTEIGNIASPNGRILYANRVYRDSTNILKNNANSLTVTRSHNLDLLYMGYLGAEYARSLKVQNADNLTFYLEGNGTDRYLEFDASGLALDQPYLTDSLGTFLLPGVVEAGLIRFKVPAFSGRHQLTLVVGPGTIETPVDIQERRLKNFNDLDANYVIISHDLLMDGGGSTSAVDEYATYRSSAQGGGYRVAVVNIRDLYDSFAYGVDYHPLSVKNFANFAGKRSVAYFFLVGRGRDYKEIRSNANLQTAINRGYGIPTYGDYGSDNLLVSESFHRVEMQVAVGRLPAVSQDEVRTYLNKIKVSDAAYQAPSNNENKIWTKKIIQINGGNVGESDQNIIGNLQRSDRQLISAGNFAGIVSEFIKGTNEAIGKPVDELFNEINEGVSIVDYFGHGSPDKLAYPIDLPERFANNPRIPILIVKGCKTGNCHVDFESMPERFLYRGNYQNHGFRVVIGSITDSYISPLGSISRQFYTQMSGPQYGQSFGEIYKDVFSTPGLQNSNEAIQQMYVGDPAIGIEPFPGPDFIVRENSVKLIPEELTSLEDNFRIKFEVLNIGAGTTDSLHYVVTYNNPKNQTFREIKSAIQNPAASQEIELEFELDKSNLVGEHTVYITLDPGNTIAEQIAPQAESNNEYYQSTGVKGFKFFVKSSALETVYPGRYAIVDTISLALSAYSHELFDKEYTYHLTIDTTEQFNSPLLQQQVIISRPGHIEWRPSAQLLPDVVYYWGIRRDSLNAQELATQAVSSFTFIQDQSGFSQSHNGQFRQNTNQGIIPEGGGNNTKFGKRDFYFRLTNALSTPQNYNSLGGFRETMLLQSFVTQRITYNTHTNGAIAVTWYRQDSMLVQFPGGTNPYGSSVVNYPNNRNFLMYETDNPESRAAMINFIDNVVGPDDIVIFFTCVRAVDPKLHAEDWAADSLTNNGKNIFNTIEKYGGIRIRELINRPPAAYSIIFDKARGVIDEKIADSTEIFSVEGNFLTNSDDGSMSQTIGPAASWEYFELKRKPAKRFKDFLTIKLTAMHIADPGLNKVITFPEDSTLNTINLSLQDIDAKEYPYINFNIYAHDKWLYRGIMDGFEYIRFVGNELPEATLLNNTFQQVNDTIVQGDPIVFQINSKNISRQPMDSMLVKFSLRSSDQTGQEIPIRFERLPIGKTSIYSTTLETFNHSGNYELICEMNPDNDQLEAYHGNNYFARRIYIQGDRQNPLVDVTFDGENIFDGDIISPKPKIRIVIRDENKIFPLADSSLFRINLKNEFGIDSFIEMNSPDIKFYPAIAGDLDKKNEAIIEFSPIFYADGDYTLAVSAKDVAGNQSGKYDFEKRFKIIRKKTISNLFNYPNPFSNATRFVYTLTGDELPKYYKIQIMSVSGKIVREITKDEMGDLKIGKHLTDYVWDGTDQYGDKLANGIYLYRMVVKDADKKKYDKYELNQTDSFFDGEWGKLVIIR